MSEYMATKKLLDDIGLTHEEADAMWLALIDANWKVAALHKSGKRWYDLTAPALKSMVTQYNQLELSHE
jgi:hypothetical protein